VPDVIRNGSDLRRRHIGELVSRLGTEAGTLVRQEMDLARAELAEGLERAKADLAQTGKQAGAGAAMFGVAGAAGLAALGALTACLVLAVNRVLPADVAALVVAAAWALVAAALALRGRDKVKAARGMEPPKYVPRQTIETFKEDVEWAKTRGRSDAR
jgi:putative superfamily III holin-X